MNREQLVEVSRSFLGTPHLNGGTVKGIGLDCCTFPAMLYRELGAAEIHVNTGYSGDWFCSATGGELLRPYLDRYFLPVAELQPGDLISYRWGRSRWAHVSVYLGLFYGREMVVHCSAADGVCLAGRQSCCFTDRRGMSRETGFWRLKNEFI